MSNELHLAPPAAVPPSRLPRSWRHPLAAAHITVPGEFEEEYQRFLGSCLEQFQPQTFLEAHMAGEYAQLQFRLLRMARIEAGLICLAYDESGCPYSKPEDRHVWALGRAHAQVARQFSSLVLSETRLRRELERALDRLLALQESRRLAALPAAERPAPARRLTRR